MKAAPTRTLVLEVRPEVAGHLAVAIQEHLRWARRMGVGYPVELVDLSQMLANRASAGQDGSPLSDLWQVRESSRVTAQLLTYADAAQVLAVGESTVKRLVRAGSFRSVHVLGSARIPVSEVRRYLDDQMHLTDQAASTGTFSKQETTA